MRDAVVLLVNPAAGHGRGGRGGARAANLLESLGMRVERVLGRGPGHLGEVAAREAERGRPRVVAVGGDGTLSEVAGGLLTTNDSSTALGVVPLGTGNDFVKSAGLARNWRAACRALATSDGVRRVDVGRVNDHWFINGVGFGFDAAIAHATARYKWLPGPLGYVAGLAAALAAGVGRPVCRLRWDGGEDCRAVTLVTACNGQYMGGLFRLAPHAQIDDGRLDLAWADALGRGQVLRYAPRVISGRHESLAVTHQARSAWLELESDTPLPAQADGELLGTAVTRLSVRLVPGALALWA